MEAVLELRRYMNTKPLWEKAGLELDAFKRLPGKEKLKLSRRYNGIRIFTACEDCKCLIELKPPVGGFLLNAWCRGNSERVTSYKNYVAPQITLKAA